MRRYATQRYDDHMITWYATQRYEWYDDRDIILK